MTEVRLVPATQPKPDFHLPGWLASLMREGDSDNVHWHTPEKIRAAAGSVSEFGRPQIVMLDEDLAVNQTLWELMVPVADGPEFTDRIGRTEPSRLFINRVDARGLLLALASDHPPTLWVAAGRTLTEVDAAAAAYLSLRIPPQSELPYQGRLFLATQATLGGTFPELVHALLENPFTEMLSWGSSQETDPYPDQVTSTNVSVDILRQFTAHAPDGLPRTSMRTRYSRSVIQLIDWQNGYFADMFFRPTSPPGWAESHNARLWTDFPAGTPVDVVGALSGLGCIGPEKIRPQAQAASDEYQRWSMQQIIGFLEIAPALA